MLEELTLLSKKATNRSNVVKYIRMNTLSCILISLTRLKINKSDKTIFIADKANENKYENSLNIVKSKILCNLGIKKIFRLNVWDDFHQPDLICSVRRTLSPDPLRQRRSVYAINHHCQFLHIFDVVIDFIIKDFLSKCRIHKIVYNYNQYNEYKNINVKRFLTKVFFFLKNG